MTVKPEVKLSKCAVSKVEKGRSGRAVAWHLSRSDGGNVTDEHAVGRLGLPRNHKMCFYPEYISVRTTVRCSGRPENHKHLFPMGQT